MRSNCKETWRKADRGGMGGRGGAFWGAGSHWQAHGNYNPHDQTRTSLSLAGTRRNSRTHTQPSVCGLSVLTVAQIRQCQAGGQGGSSSCHWHTMNTSTWHCRPDKSLAARPSGSHKHQKNLKSIRIVLPITTLPPPLSLPPLSFALWQETFTRSTHAFLTSASA